MAAAGQAASASVEITSPVFVYGTIANQDGWSGLTNSYAQDDSFPAGSEVPNDEDDRGDSIVGPNTPEPGEVHQGNQAWWLKRGYDGPGSGTAYTPNLATNQNDADDDGTPDQGFRYEIWFKAANEGGDGSRIAVITGDPAGNDRASNYLELVNNAGDLTVRRYDFGISNYITLANNLDTTVWHHLEATMERDGVYDFWTYTIDGELVGGPVAGFFSRWRDQNGFDYTESSRVKFQPRHANYDAGFLGFFFDDLVTETIDTATGEIVESYSTGFE